MPFYLDTQQLDILIALNTSTQTHIDKFGYLISLFLAGPADIVLKATSKLN